jgi:transposase
LERENKKLRDVNRSQYRQIQTLTKENARLKSTVEKQAARIAELESKLLLASKDSTTSSKPPSSDDPQQRKNRYPKRHRSGLLPGGQHGHDGAKRDWSTTPDSVTKHAPVACGKCGHGLSTTPSTVGEKRQVVDVVVTTTTAEHQVLIKQCPCCNHATTGEFPREATGTVCFGPGVKAP